MTGSGSNTSPSSPAPPRSAFVAAVARLQRAQLRLAATALIVMMLVTVADVTLRYLFNSPIRGSYDLVEVMLVVFVFHGMAGVFFRRQNIAIDLIDSFVSRGVVALLTRFADVVSIAALCLLFWAMTGPAWQVYEYGDRKIDLDLPVYLLWIAALAGMVGVILAAVAALVVGPDPDSHPRSTAE